MTSTVVGCPSDRLRIGMELEVIFDDVTAEVTLPRIRRAEQ